MMAVISAGGVLQLISKCTAVVESIPSSSPEAKTGLLSGAELLRLEPPGLKIYRTCSLTQISTVALNTNIAMSRDFARSLIGLNLVSG